jgi:membrane associated rhomboid family serine protease
MLFERDYMRNDEGTSSIPSFYWILFVTCGVCALQVLGEFFFKHDFIGQYGALSKYSFISNLHIWTLVTYGFLHVTLFHILGNMLGYYFLGRALIGILNQGKFLTLYLGGIIAGGVLWLIFNQNGTSPLMGASAGVSALLIFFCCIYANRPVSFFFVPIFIPARLIGWGFFFLTLFLFLMNLDRHNLQDQGHAIAHSAHLGGMIWGWFYYKVLYPIRIVWPRITIGRKQSNSQRATAYHYKVNIGSQKDQDAMRREVDRILDKINTKGFGSLTDEEKQTLDQARNILKR